MLKTCFRGKLVKFRLMYGTHIFHQMYRPLTFAKPIKKTPTIMFCQQRGLEMNASKVQDERYLGDFCTIVFVYFQFCTIVSELSVTYYKLLAVSETCNSHYNLAVFKSNLQIGFICNPSSL